LKAYGRAVGAHKLPGCEAVVGEALQQVWLLRVFAIIKMGLAGNPFSGP